MIRESLTQLLLPWQRMAELALQEEAARWDGPPRLIEAMRYAVLGGGKRLRPVLTLAAAAAAGGRVEDAKGAAVALELIHAYSLVHDDLPSLDDDVERRGAPTVHVQYGEALALLAGDALQTAAFEALLAPAAPADPALRLEAMACLTSAAGAVGMVGGQVLDIEVPAPTAEALKEMHAMKTGALFVAAVEMASVVTGASREIRSCLLRYGQAVGAAFQLSDDLLDLAELDGAEPDKHEANVNLAAVLGVDVALRETNSMVAAALDALADLPGDKAVLEGFARWIGARVTEITPQ